MEEFKKKQEQKLEQHKQQLAAISAFSAIFLVIALALLIVLYFYYGSADEAKMRLCALGLCASVAIAVILSIVRRIIIVRCKEVTKDLDRMKDY
jgi:polyferredoxin